MVQFQITAIIVDFRRWWYTELHFLPTHDIITQTTISPLRATGPEGEIKKGPTASQARQALRYTSFLLSPGRPGSDSIPRAAFRVKQESGFVFGDISV